MKSTQAYLPTAFVSPAMVSTGSKGQQMTSQGWKRVNEDETDGTWDVMGHEEDFFAGKAICCP